MRNEFLSLIGENQADLKKHSAAFNTIGYTKLFLVLLIGYLIYLALAGKFSPMLAALLAVALIILIVLWVYHAKLGDNIDYAKGMIAICSRHIDRITGNWITFEDTGAEFADAAHAYGCDLDIVGRKSLFQFLNTTHTWHGRQAFVKDLLHAKYDDDEIKERQTAVSELSGDIDCANKIEYYLSKIGADASASQLVDELKNKNRFTKRRSLRFLITYMPLMSLIFILIMFVLQRANIYLYIGLAIALQAIVWIASMPRIHKYLGIITQLPYKLIAYSEAIDVINGMKFSSGKLNRIKDKLTEAADAIRNLGRISDKISIKNNVIIYFIANILFLWDFECIFLFEEWKNKYSPLAEQWFLALGEFESLLCLSHLPKACDNTCMPTIYEQQGMIEAKGIGHPLLPNRDRVNNALKFDNNIFIISGSNMSGKTTFLRTVGINLVLMRSGGFVCAEKMSCSLFNIITSMRISDDLSEGVSTFYAELKRIKRIIDIAEKRTDIMFLIDEIFRGTNSVDRLIGAKAVIARLNALEASGLISTHDLELCELAVSSERIKNFNFSEYYTGNNINFEYRLRPGKSNTTNAKFLMEMVGITKNRIDGRLF